MCFNKAKSTQEKTSTTTNENKQYGASEGAYQVVSDGGSINIDSTSDEAISEAFDFLRTAEEGNQYFGQSVLELAGMFASGAVESSQNFAKEVLAQQNPNDSNRVEYVAYAAIGAVALIMIVQGVFDND